MGSFIGFVTRKDVQTGVTLRAKIVTPSGKKYGSQEFKVMVKATGLSDMTSCILDLNTTMATLTEKGITTITQNITSAMPSSGEHATSISYEFENIGAQKITDYISVDGVIIKRPKYGEEAVIGKLVITVSKGKDSVDSKMDIVVIPYSIEEIYTSALAFVTWNVIRGNNAVESNDSASGLRNVMNSLNLISKIPASSIAGTAVDLTVTWTVVDTLQSYAEQNSLYTGKRIDETTGAVTRPDYTKAYNIFQSVGESYGMALVQGSVPMIRMGGVTLTATIGLASETLKVTKQFQLSTLSKYLTNAEVAQWLTSNIKAVLDDGTSYLQMSTASNTIAITELDDQSIRVITTPKSATGFGSGAAIGISKINADMVTTINAFDNQEDLKTYASNITSGPIVNEDLGITTISFNLAAARSLSATDKKFVLKGTINVWAYSSNGLTPGGEPSTSKAIWKFEMITKTA